LPTLVTGTVGPVLIYKNRPALGRSTMDRMCSKISTKIDSDSTNRSIIAMLCITWKCP